MSQLKQQIIDLIKRNRISSVEVSDALGKAGVIKGLIPLVPKKFAVGEVRYIYAHSCSNWSIHEQAQELLEGGILFVDTFDCEDYAVFGDIVSKYLLLYKGYDGIIVNGAVRDVHILIKEDYPIWSAGVTPLGCHNKKVSLSPTIKQSASDRRFLFEGSIIVADDSGCTLISHDMITDATLKKLEFIELQEDIWYYCLDTLKWSTYKIICEKAYLTDIDALPNSLKSRLSAYLSHNG